MCKRAPTVNTSEVRKSIRVVCREKFNGLLTFVMPKDSTPQNFMEKTSANSHKTVKFTKVFSLKSPQYIINKKPLIAHCIFYTIRMVTSSLSLTAVVSARAPQTTKQTPFRDKDDSCPTNAASVSTPMPDDVFTSENVRVSPTPSASTQKERAQRPPFGCGCGNCTFHSYLENGCPHPIPTTGSFPYLNTSGLTPEEQKQLKTRLCVESEDIMFKFQRLFSRVYKSLCEQNVSVNKLVTHLLTLGSLDPVSKDSQKPLLQTFFQELQNAKSIENVLWAIRDYFSFFNYHVLEHIVAELGTAQDKTELENYKREFNQYSKRRIFECPPVYGSRSSAGHADLVLKMGSAYDLFTVKELEKFQLKLSKIFHISPKSVLRLCQVEEGCLQLTFQIPSFLQQKIFPLSNKQQRALSAVGVTKLTCGNYQFSAKVSDKYPELP